MNILYTLNDKFAPQVGSSIISFCENNKETKDITFHLITLNFSKDNINKMKKVVKKYKRKINFYELEDLSKYIDFDFDTKGWNKVIVARLLLDKILPESVHKVLYLDGDTVVRNSVSDLYDSDMNGKIIGMSIEPTIDKSRIQELELGNLPYCNSGVLLIDLKKWRDLNIGKKIFDYYKEKGGNLFAADQDILNAVLKNDIYHISPRYNYCNIFDQYNYKFFVKRMKPIDYSLFISIDDFKESRSNPVIVHYLGEERPWRKGSTHKYKKDYLKYLSESEWCNEPLETGWELYFICWKIFNTLTKPFPALRLKIINGLIPFIMKLRSKKVRNDKNG